MCVCVCVCVRACVSAHTRALRSPCNRTSTRRVCKFTFVVDRRWTKAVTADRTCCGEGGGGKGGGVGRGEGAA